MGRWTQYDEDDYRLPEGVKRVGYDADSGRYYFHDSEGLVYNGPEGSEFGELMLVSEIPTSIPRRKVDEDSDLEAAPTGTDVQLYLSQCCNKVRQQWLGWGRALAARLGRWRDCRWVGGGKLDMRAERLTNKYYKKFS